MRFYAVAACFASWDDANRRDAVFCRFQRPRSKQTCYAGTRISL